MIEQLNIFSCIEGNYKIKKPIRLIELFAGIGSQAKALELLGVPFEHHKICEWAYNSIVGYNAIHIKDFKDYSDGKTKEELIAYLNGNISIDYNKPCDCTKRPLEWLKNAYNNCIATHNLINIMNVKGKDLEIVDTDKYEYVMTYSFPCQDLSASGKRQGMSLSQSEGGTRSGLLWEVERILTELNGGGQQLPQILIMENVPEVVGTRNIKDFQKWENKLSELGYINHIQILNAKYYGIPQNRKRCFMVSILNGHFQFGGKMPLKYKLKDFLEKNVNEKYYLSKEKIQNISNWKAQQKPLDNMNKNIDIAPTLTARGAGEEHSGMVLVNENLFKEGEVIDWDSSDKFRRVYGTEISPTLVTHPKIGVAHINKKSLKEEMVDKLISDGKVKENDVIRHSYTTSQLNGKKKDIHQNNIMATLDTRCDCLGVVVKEEDVKLRIRKLTPKETIRLMGFEDKDCDALMKIGLSESAIYHCAGDSIVTTVLMMIFSKLIYEDESAYRSQIQHYVINLKQ